MGISREVLPLLEWSRELNRVWSRQVQTAFCPAKSLEVYRSPDVHFGRMLPENEGSGLGLSWFWWSATVETLCPRDMAY